MCYIVYLMRLLRLCVCLCACSIPDDVLYEFVVFMKLDKRHRRTGDVIGIKLFIYQKTKSLSSYYILDFMNSNELPDSFLVITDN